MENMSRMRPPYPPDWADEQDGGGQGSPDEIHAREQQQQQGMNEGAIGGGYPDLRNPIGGRTEPAGEGKAPLPEDDPRHGLYAYLLQQKNRRQDLRALPNYADLEEQGRANADHKALSGLAIGLQDAASMAGTLGGKRADIGQLPAAAKMIDEGAEDSLKNQYNAIKQRSADVRDEAGIYKSLADAENATTKTRDSRQELYDRLQSQRDIAAENNASREKIAGMPARPGPGKTDVWKLDKDLTDEQGNPLYTDGKGGHRPLPSGLKAKEKPEKEGKNPYQKLIDTEEVGGAKNQKVADIMDQQLPLFKKLYDEGKVDEATKVGEGMLKGMNAAFGTDAVGVEESNRIGGFLKPFKKPWETGSMFHRDLDKFYEQAVNYSNSLKGAARQSYDRGSKLRGGGKPEVGPDLTPDLTKPLSTGKPLHGRDLP